MARIVTRSIAILTLSALTLSLALVLAAPPAVAQELPKLQTEEPVAGGYCAPWHRCVAYGALGLAGLSVLAFGAGYLVQSRGFHRLEHRQGNPEGVPAGKE